MSMIKIINSVIKVEFINKFPVIMVNGKRPTNKNRILSDNPALKVILLIEASMIWKKY